MEKIELKVPLENIENILGTVTSPSIVLSELIKNSVDSNANYIRVDIYTQPENRILVTDYGDGLSFEDIKNLGVISTSNKKIGGNLYRKDGAFLTGSKGLGILSLFSIANKFIMETERDNVRYKVIWAKGQSSFTCEQISCKNVNGTEISCIDIADEYMAILTDENELNKLKHISIKNYICSNLIKKDILFYVNNRQCAELEVPHINDIKEAFIGLLNFQYESNSNTLTFQYIFKNDCTVNSNSLEILLDEDLNTDSILVNHYNVTEVTSKRKLCKYLKLPLESFSGEIFVTEQRRNRKLHMFGPGVRVFVNQFAMYGYLDRENDWLNFSIYSMLLKNTRFKPHNVFGYIHFENLNENESHLMISNERAYFIENGAYKKFQEIMKNIVIPLAFNIDVAQRNGWIDKSSNKEGPHQEGKLDEPKNDPHSVNHEKQDHPAQSNTNENQNKPEDTKPNSKETAKTEESPQSQDSEFSKQNNNRDLNSNKGSNVALEKKPLFNFFKTSRVLKHPEKIKIGYDELINQLSKLNYKDYYLLYVIAFRAILEDVSKKYLNSRGINLSGDFGQNVRIMADDILRVVKDPRLISLQDKTFIENRLGGYNAFKGYFELIGPDFHNNGKQAAKALKLNSYVHSPRWMEIEEAEDIANNTILPLYVISNDIIERIKK